MKTTTKNFLIATSMFLSYSVLANNEKYIEAMQKNIELVYKGGNATEIQEAINSFERIGAAEKSKWEPYYYAAYGYIMLSNYETEAAEKDAYLDEAMKAIDNAKALSKDNAEIVTLEGFALMVRLTVDPQSRGQIYAAQINGAFNKALALDAENPRALALLAQMQFGTAQFFGSSTTEACGNAEKSLDKFATYSSDNLLAPQWGKSFAERLKGQCG